MYCQLCRVEASLTHDSSSGHHAARELAAAAVDRLSNHLEAGDAPEGTNSTETDKTVKEAVGFCESCNVVFQITEHSAHLRKREHVVALLNEQKFEELVQAYVGEEPKLELNEPTDAGEGVDESEAINTYTCHLCDLEVPQVFKSVHELGSRHRNSRIVTLAAARRARDAISARSGSDGGKGHKFTGKMMKRLVKAYTGYDEDKSEIVEVEPPSKPQPKLTAKEYFADILPFLPYVGSFYNLIIDDSEFVTVQIGNDTLKIHVNNINGVHNIEGNGGSMTCRLCDVGNTCYSSIGQQDKLHVMSLGHIKNVLSPIESVHLIRKVDDTHSLCGLCNLHIHTHYVDNHILKDTRHTMALSEALDRGKQYKENKDNLKIMIFMPPAQKQNIFMKPNQFNNSNQSRWTFGLPQQPRHFSGSLFGCANNSGFGSTQATLGSAQNSGFASAQNTGFGSTQNTCFGTQNSGFGSTQSTGFGSTQSTGFGSAQATFGSAQNSSLGGAKSSIFGVTSQPSVFNSLITQQNATAFRNTQNTNLSAQNQGQSSAINNASTPQNASTVGSAGFWNSTGNCQSSPTNNSQALFGNAQSNATFGAAQTAQANAQPNPVNSGGSQGNSTVFGSAQNTAGLFGNAQKDSIGVSPHKKAANAPGQINNSSNDSKLVNSWSAWNQKSTSNNDWSDFYKKGNSAAINRPVQVGWPQNNTTSLQSQSQSANSVNSQQNAFVNAQSPSQKGSESEQEKKFGDAQTQIKNVEADAQVNKPATIRPPMKPRNYSSSSDSD